MKYFYNNYLQIGKDEALIKYMAGHSKSSHVLLFLMRVAPQFVTEMSGILNIVILSYALASYKSDSFIVYY